MLPEISPRSPDAVEGAPARVLVTGAGGFVGHWLMAALAARLPAGGEVVAAVHQAADTPAGATRHVVFDITDQAATEAAVAAVAPTAVVHLAAISTIEAARRDPRYTWAVNLNGTMNLAEAVLRHAPQARFVFVGTAEAYGASQPGDGTPIDENMALAPVNPYAASKAAADLMIGHMARDGLQAVRLRPFNHTGPGQGERFVVPAFAAQIARIEAGLQEPVIHVGNLDAARDFCDVRDIVAAYAVAALGAPALAPGTVLNLASGVPRRIRDILDDLLREARVPIRLQVDAARLRPNDTPISVGDASRARALLGWTPHIAWATTLADILAYWRARHIEAPAH